VLDGPTVVGHLVAAVNTETLSANKSLVAADANVQALTASGASRNVTLPDPATMTFGHSYRIINAGSSNNLVLKDFGGTTLATLTPGQSATVKPMSSGGALVWPASVATE
jgi:hypothetical protein